MLLAITKVIENQIEITVIISFEIRVILKLNFKTSYM